MAERKPNGYWTEGRINAAICEAAIENGGAPVSAIEFRKKYDGADCAMRKRFNLTYNKWLSSVGLEPANERNVITGDSREAKIDEILVSSPRTYKEISYAVGIPVRKVGGYFMNHRRRKKYGSVALAKNQGTGGKRSVSDQDLFTSHGGETLVYLKSEQTSLPKRLAEILSSNMSVGKKCSATHLLHHQISNEQIDEMWFYYDQFEEQELEEMGVLLPQ